MQNRLCELIMPLVKELIKQLSDSLDKSDNKPSFYSIELALFAALSDFALKLIVVLIQVMFERGYEGSRIVCSNCGQKAKFQRYSNRHIISCWGHLDFKRAYYYCLNCKTGCAPLDSTLLLNDSGISPRLTRVISFHSAHNSFEVVEKGLQEDYCLSLSDEAIRQAAERVGLKAREWEDQQASQAQSPALVETKPQGEPKTWILEIDGKRVGLQDGSWREVKVGVIYELGARIEPSEGRHELLKREIVARRCDWQEFIAQFWAAMQRCGIAAGDRLVAIADGAEWIESVFEFVAPNAERIRDYYHVAEKVYLVGEMRYGAGSDKAKGWIKIQLDKLKESDASSVVRSIKKLKLEREEEDKARKQVIGYIEKNLSAMEYGRYKQESLPIGSGAVEGGCKLIGARTNGNGRRWSEAGCDQIISLRVAVLNDRLDVILPKPNIEKLAA